MKTDIYNNRVILAVLDGWGISPKTEGNAIAQASTPNMDRMSSTYPFARLSASGEFVGLPRSEVGNTETGHLNLGAGKIVYQDLARINMSIADGSFFENKVLINAIEHARSYESNLHYIGLVGAGGVHSNIEHLFALIHMTCEKQFDRVYIHIITDGRDSPPTSSLTYISKVKELIKKEKVGKIASVMGRYWAMDRDRRWDRTEKAYNALTKGEGHLVKTIEEAIEGSYNIGKTDEFIEPSLMSTKSGTPIATIKDNDAVVFFNFRIDRPRQLSKAFVAKDFTKSSKIWDFDPYAIDYEKTHQAKKKDTKTFSRGERIDNLYFATMTEYGKPLVKDGAKVAYPPEHIKMPLGRVLELNHKRQLKCAESEKERFVTYYFNGQRRGSFQGEDSLIVRSPNVSTYDLKPEMSSRVLTKQVLEKIKSAIDYSFILINYAAPDMVGHTGNLKAAIIACEAVDQCIGELEKFILTYSGTLLITADHGNVEEMINPETGEANTEHSKNMVPFIAVSKKFIGNSRTLTSGILADVAPTVLALLGLRKPSQMTGRDLLK